MQYNPLHYPYGSRRNAVFAKNGMVATSQPLAAQAGLDILKKGGNAIDAAIATAACLTVVEPTSNGIGGDAFALVWTKGELHGLNASGPAPRSISIAAVQQRGYAEMPKYGWIPVTVPGAPSAWAALSKRFGRLPFAEVLQPAIRYAEEGYPVSPTLGKYWKIAFAKYAAEAKGDEFRHWFATFAPHGRAPEIGEMWRSPDHARTLRLIAETHAEAFYRGELAEEIDRFSRQHDGFLRKEDLAAYEPEWVQPIRVNYRGYDVWEIPPNGQGLVALLALQIVKGFDFPSRDTADTYHKQIEAIKLAFADGLAYITQRDKMKVRVEDLLSESYAAARRELIGDKALQPAPGEPPKGGTVYLAAADAEGNMVSFIQSNYMGFGSGLVVPGTGISLQNRGHNFSLDPAHDNCLEPGKKTYHTIIPGFLTKDDQPVGPFGVMGGFMQPQGHMQVVMNLIDFHLNPQAALDAPRWQWIKGKTVELESTVPEHIALALAEKGHDVRWALGSGGFGRGQIIVRNEHGVLVGGTEPRTDGCIAAW
ncbi:gamma-glutamyltransferase family protein [Brevibacillus sp. SYP-B805]|uniref:gamma-glutamyltransferase family protein n=1 Tax=Brevibacillus sp. SYP-B805 TaxID=1578199 RepID=UPI0013EB6DEA|nr:gamma-glutamyltransferase family protein [Brevibacillus sp. SYP-B805]NGQ97145.1 gamma-glutamyltransferase family protein [Brevibacillus sp. SYP-B805]